MIPAVANTRAILYLMSDGPILFQEIEMSKRMKLSPLTVMQNLNVIHGTPTWSAQFITSQIMGCGRFENFDYLVKGEGETLEVQCIAKRIADQKIINLPKILKPIYHNYLQIF